jgi:subtilisin family serine protease
MNPLDLVQLGALMNRTSGTSAIRIGLIDGPVALDHPALASENIRQLGQGHMACRAHPLACVHGTAVAGILSGRRGSPAPAICPDCTLLLRPIFAKPGAAAHEMPSASPQELAQALDDCLAARPHVINISAALARPALHDEPVLDAALGRAARDGVIVVAAAGNQGTLGSTTITRHPWVLPVVAYGTNGRPIGYSNLGRSIGSRGLGAPGDWIRTLGPDGQSLGVGGTSAAAPFVTGTIALLLSEFPRARAADIRQALIPNRISPRTTLVPPLLNATAAYDNMRSLS